MTNTAKNTSTDVPPLSWTGKKVWGAVGNTYHAEADGWRYTVDQPRKGQWVLRGWGPDGAFLYRDCFTTMKAAKATAGEHRDEYLAAKMVVRKSCTECGRTTTHKLDCSKGRA